MNDSVIWLVVSDIAGKMKTVSTFLIGLIIIIGLGIFVYLSWKILLALAVMLALIKMTNKE